MRIFPSGWTVQEEPEASRVWIESIERRLAPYRRHIIEPRNKANKGSLFNASLKCQLPLQAHSTFRSVILSRGLYSNQEVDCKSGFSFVGGSLFYRAGRLK